MKILRISVFGAALLGIAIAAPATASGSQDPLGIVLTQTVALNEPVFILINQTARRDLSFISSWDGLKASLVARGIVLTDTYVGSSHLYLKVTLPLGSYLDRNSLIEKLKKEPLVSNVIAASSANAELKDFSILVRVDPTAKLSESMLHGYREKMIGYKPDAKAPHTAEILVKYLESESFVAAKRAAVAARLSALHSQLGAKVKQTMETDRGPIEVVELPAVVDFGKALQLYLDAPEVEFAQPNYIYTASFVPNDTFFGSLWGMTKIQAPTAWDTRTDASSVVVAVADTGIDYNHPDLNGNMWSSGGTYGWNAIANNTDPMDDHNRDRYGNFYEVYHGTHCAGTVGAYGNNGLGVVGVAQRSKLMAIKVLNEQGSGTTQSTADGLDWARTHGAQIISASWGWGTGYTIPDMILRDALVRLSEAGVVFANAANNFGLNIDSVENVQYPARYGLSNMIVVGSSDQNDARSSFSNFGRYSVDVFAPGTDIYSTMQNNRYQYLSGTSMATPHVAGLLALAKAQFPWEDSRELIDRIRLSVDRSGTFDSLCLSGGRINAARALSTRPRLFNLSTRCQVNTGDQIGIAGIVIHGPNAKRVAFRAQGPTLANYGISGALANPQITILNGSGQVIGSNNDWQTLSSADQAELVSHYMNPSNSLESAWIGNLSPGSYTVQLSGVNGGTGIGMIESFDVDASTQNRLFNISTRAYVGSGDALAIAGLIISGDKPRQVYIRALGPSLANLGVSGALQDTTLALNNSSGQQIAFNDDWGSNDAVLQTRLTNTGYPPSDYRESAIVMNLDPGTYTVHLNGKNGATGVGLIEVNEF